MFPMDWNALIRHIDRALPGRGLWMLCVPVFDGDRTTEEGVGLAIQRESGPKDRWYSTVFFSVVPDPDAVGADGTFLPGRGEQAADWTVDVCYRGEHDTLQAAIYEAKGLAADLPMNHVFVTEERLDAILDRVTDPEDLEEIA